MCVASFEHLLLFMQWLALLFKMMSSTLMSLISPAVLGSTWKIPPAFLYVKSGCFFLRFKLPWLIMSSVQLPCWLQWDVLLWLWVPSFDTKSCEWVGSNHWTALYNINKVEKRKHKQLQAFQDMVQRIGSGFIMY